MNNRGFAPSPTLSFIRSGDGGSLRSTSFSLILRDCGQVAEAGGSGEGLNLRKWSVTRTHNFLKAVNNGKTFPVHSLRSVKKPITKRRHHIGANSLDVTRPGVTGLRGRCCQLVQKKVAHHASNRHVPPPLKSLEAREKGKMYPQSSYWSTF